MPDIPLKIEDLANSHSYYTSETNYFAGGNDRHGQCHHDTIEDFLAEWGDADLDYNAVFRWDINEVRDEETDEFHGKYSMQITMIIQRKGNYMPVMIKSVTQEDLPAIMEWLQIRYEYIKDNWRPLV